MFVFGATSNAHDPKKQTAKTEKGEIKYYLDN
jgi:hypothetical protein